MVPPARWFSVARATLQRKLAAGPSGNRKPKLALRLGFRSRSTRQRGNLRTIPSAVSYTKVSTAKQGQSGLGLEVQEAAITAFCTHMGSTLPAATPRSETGKDHDVLNRR